MSYNKISLQTFSKHYNEPSRENNVKNLSIYGNNELLEEQKKQFQDNGKISDKYLLP